MHQTIRFTAMVPKLEHIQEQKKTGSTVSKFIMSDQNKTQISQDFWMKRLQIGQKMKVALNMNPYK